MTSLITPIPFTGAMLVVDVNGIPAPQGSKRAFANHHTGRVNVVESSAKVKPWREAVRTETQQALAAGDTLTLTGALSAYIQFFLPRPASLPRKITYPIKRPDLDKLLRSTLDGLTAGGAFADDSQIVQIITVKTFGAVPGCHIRLEELT